MRIILLSFFFIAYIVELHAQTDTLVCKFGDSLTIDVQPEFPGGDIAFLKFLQARIMYPEDAKRNGIQGYTHIEFIIEKNGSLSNIKTVEGKGLSASCDQEVIRVISSSPKWKPGMRNGMPIRTKRIQKIKFVLPDSPSGIALTTEGKQVTDIDPANDTTVFLSVDRMPEFADKKMNFYKFIHKNLIYPKDAKKKKIKGYVLVSFVVEKDGTISNIHIVQGKNLYPSCDQAALDVVLKFPKFIPGKHKGKLARVKQTVIVAFE